MSIRRGCCCGGCPAAVDVTFTGLDAARCAGCQRTSLSNSLTMNASGLDGTYNLTYAATDGTGCRYSLIDTSLSVELHSGSTTCGGVAATTSVSQNIIVWLDAATGTKVVRVQFGTSASATPVFASAFYKASISVDLGVDITSSLTGCVPNSVSGYYNSRYCSSGTANVVAA